MGGGSEGPRSSLSDVTEGESGPPYAYELPHGWREGPEVIHHPPSYEVIHHDHGAGPKPLKSAFKFIRDGVSSFRWNPYGVSPGHVFGTPLSPDA